MNVSCRCVSIVKALECLTYNSFKRRDFSVSQFLEFIGPPPVRQCSFVLPYEHDKVFGEPVGHFDGVHDAPERFIVTTKIVDFPRQIVLNRPHDTSIEKFRHLRGVKKTRSEEHTSELQSLAYLVCR